jgi:hypothetical protein
MIIDVLFLSTYYIQEATHLVNQLHPELLDNDRYLYFHLQQLHLIELIRSGKIEEALTFAQTQISEAGENIGVVGLRETPKQSIFRLVGSNASTESEC